MKLVFSIVLFVALVPLFAENLVRNADLKKFNLKTGNPYYWKNIPALSGSRIVNEDNSKQFVLELASPEKKKNVHWIGALKKINAGQIYLFTVKVKAPKNQVFRIYVERNKPTFKACNGGNWYKGTGEWQNISFEFSYKTPGANPYFAFCTNGIKKCFATDFKVITKK